MNQPYAKLTLASALREVFGVQLYKNNARALLSRILSILNLEWLQHARSVCGVYEYRITKLFAFFSRKHQNFTNFIAFLQYTAINVDQFLCFHDKKIEQNMAPKTKSKNKHISLKHIKGSTSWTFSICPVVKPLTHTSKLPTQHSASTVTRYDF